MSISALQSHDPRRITMQSTSSTSSGGANPFVAAYGNTADWLEEIVGGHSNDKVGTAEKALNEKVLNSSFLDNVVRTFIPGRSRLDGWMSQNLTEGTESQYALGIVIGTITEIVQKNPKLWLKGNKAENVWKLIKNASPEELSTLLHLADKTPEEAASSLKQTLACIDLMKAHEEGGQVSTGQYFDENGNTVNVTETVEAIKKDTHGFEFKDLLKESTKRYSGLRQIGIFAVLPAMGQGLFKTIRPLVEANQTLLAQFTAMLGMGLTFGQSFLISESVCRHLDYSQIQDRNIQRLIPILKVGTILSHNIRPLLQLLGIGFNFDGFIGKGESNWFGKVTEFLGSGLELLRPFSMLGFALAHLSGMEKHKVVNPSSKAENLKFGYEKFGFWVNIIGFGASLIAQPLSMFIEHHQKKVNAKFEPVMEKIQKVMLAEEERLKNLVMAGKMSKEEAIKKLTALEADAKEYIQRKIIPAYEAEMAGWKTAEWAVGVINWASFLGINIQMLTNGFRQSMYKAASIKDQMASSGEKIGWGGAYWKAVMGESNQQGWRAATRIFMPGGPVLGLTALGVSTAVDGISTLFGNGSPFSADGPPELVQKLKNNWVYQTATTFAMFT